VHFGPQVVTTSADATPAAAPAPQSRGFAHWGVALGGVGLVAFIAAVVVVARRRRIRRQAAEARVQMMNPAIEISRPNVVSV